MDVRLTIKPNRCRLNYGTAPCTASGTTKCYNTRTTCQDIPNILLARQDIVYTTAGVQRTESIFNWSDGTSLNVPASPTITSAVINSGQLALEGVASGNTAKIELDDETSLIEVDDRYADEDGRENCGGSRFGRLLARDRLLHSSPATIEFKEPGEAEWVITYWQIDSISYPVDGKSTVNLVDPVTHKLSTPYPSEVPLTLIGDETNNTQNLGVTGNPEAGSRWRIESEIVENVDSGNIFIRGAYGTEMKEHKAGVKLTPVKQIGEYDGTELWHDIYRDLMEDHLPGVIDEADRITESAKTANMTVRMLVTRPQPFRTILAELCMAGQCAIYFDILVNKLRYRANTVFGTPDHVLTDHDYLFPNLPQVKTEPKTQKTRNSYRYRLENPVDDKTYTDYALAANFAEEGLLGYDIGDAIENQYAYTGDAASARRTQRYSVLPLSIACTVSIADYSDVALGDLVGFSYSEAYQGVDGCIIQRDMIVTRYSLNLIEGLKNLQGLVVNQIFNEVIDSGGGIAPVIPTNTGGGGTLPPDTSDPEFAFSVYITDDTENVNLYNLAGQPIVPIIINLFISPGVLIGGTVGAALSINTFAAGSSINIYMGDGSFIIGASGRPSDEQTIKDGGHGVEIIGDYALAIAMDTAGGSAQICGGGGAGGNGGDSVLADADSIGRPGEGYYMGDIFNPSNGVSGTGGVGGESDPEGSNLFVERSSDPGHGGVGGTYTNGGGGGGSSSLIVQVTGGLGGAVAIGYAGSAGLDGQDSVNGIGGVGGEAKPYDSTLFPSLVPPILHDPSEPGAIGGDGGLHITRTGSGNLTIAEEITCEGESLG